MFRYKTLIITALTICIFVGSSTAVVEAHIPRSIWLKYSAEALEADRFVEAIPIIYDDVWGFSDGLAIVRQGDYYGYVDNSGSEVVPPLYDWVTAFSEGLALIRTQDEKYSYIDPSGKVILSVEYDSAWLFEEGLAPVSIDDKWGFIDRTGREVLPLIYSSVMEFSEGLAPAADAGGLWGFIDKNGKEVLPAQYESASGFTDGFAWVMLNSKWGMIDKSGTEILPFIYDQVMPFREGLAGAMFEGRWGFVDKTGEVIVPYIYEGAFSFSEGLAPVMLGEKWGFIGYIGNLVVPFEFTNVSSMSAGLIVAEDNEDKWVYRVIDSGGNILFLSDYDDIRGFSEGMAPVRRSGKWGFIKDNNFLEDAVPQSWDGSGVRIIQPDTTVNSNGSWAWVGPFFAGVAATCIIGAVVMTNIKRFLKKMKNKNRERRVST
jgi:hypothetical protein